MTADPTDANPTATPSTATHTTRTTPTDPWGCPVTGDDDERQLVSDAMADYVTMSPAIVDHLEPLGQGGPLAKSLAAMLLAQAHRPATTARARELATVAATEAEAQAGAGGPGADLSPREHLYVRAAAAWADGHTDRVIDDFEAVLTLHPTDAFALRARYLLLFSSGRVPDMVSMVAGVRPSWSPELPFASYLDGMEGFGLEESGRYADGEAVARRGVDADGGDLWAIHAVAHVLEMERRREEGVAWLDEHADALQGGGFAGHLWWHQAIQLWALGRYDDALAAFDRRVYPGGSTEGLDLTNAISPLVRLESTDVDVGPRWNQLADPALVRLGQHSHPFNDTHFVLALSRAGRVDDAEGMVAELRRWAELETTAAGVLRDVGVAVADGLLAYGRGQWTAAVGRLEPAVDRLWRLGGSQAQRFLYTIVLDHARERAGAH